MADFDKQLSGLVKPKVHRRGSALQQRAHRPDFYISLLCLDMDDVIPHQANRSF